MSIDWEKLRKKAQKKIDEERGSISVQEVLPRVNQTNKEQITVNLTPNNKVLEIATKRQAEYQKELEKQKEERKQREQEAYDNTQKLKKEYQESQKWLMQHSDQNNTVIGKTTQEYIDKSNEMLSQGEAYAKAMDAYEKEYAEEYKNRMKESNAKSMAEFPETVKEVSKNVITGIGSNVALGFTRGVNAVGNFIKENAPVLTSNKYNTQQEMADYEQKYGLNENNKQEILEQYKNKYGTLEQALNVITEEKSKLQKIHDDIGGYGIYYDKQGYEEREKNIEKLKYERDLISNALNKASVPDNIYEVGSTLLDTVGVGDFFDTFGGDFAKPLNDVGDVGEEKLSETANRFAEVAPKMSGLSQNVGSLVPSIIATGVTGNAAVGTAVFAAKAKNDYYNEYLNQGYTKTEANNLSNIMTAVEVGSEYLGDIAGGVNILKKGALKDWASKPLNQAIKGYVIEGGEEVLSEVSGMIVTGENVTLEEFDDRVKSAFAGGVALSVVMTGVGKTGSIISKCKEKLSNGQKLTMSEVEQVIQEQADNEGKSVEEILDEYGDKIGEVSQNLVNNIEENINVNNEEVLPTANNQNNITTDNETLPTANQNSSVNTNNTQTELSNMLKTKDSQQYQYIISNNTKVNALNESASKYFNNSKESKGYLSALSKIIKDKDIEIKFDGNLKTPDGKVARGSYSNGVITINPYSNSVGEFVAMHEITHAIGTQNMIKMLDKFKNSNVEFNNEMKALLENYSSTEINEEALADVSAQLFGTQEFINNVAEAQPSLFQKIYSEIKYLWHQFRGYKNQNQFINDLYFKWTQTYNSNNKLNNTTNYHVSENFSNEIDKVLNNQLKTNTQVKARNFTPQILVDNGVENLPMLITQKHIKSTIYTLQEAKSLGLSTKNINYHGLGKDLLIKAIDNLDNPQAIYKTDKNNYLVVTEFKDSNGKEIVVPIQINGNGRYNDVFISENQIKSVYGRNNLNNYIDKNNFKQIYKKNKELDFNEGIQYSNVANSSIIDSIPSSNKDVNTTTKYSMQESENNSGSFNFNKNVKRYEDLQEASAIKFNQKTDGTINVEIINNNELINQFSVSSKDDALKQLGSDIANYIYDNVNEDGKTIKLEKTKNIEAYATSHKGKQLEIIKKTNPMMDDYHVGIRTVEDIKTFGEVISDEESFAWGDFTKEDAKKALEEGKITVYSSYPINQGTFVSTSKVQAKEYAGGRSSKIYSKIVPLDEVAWINGDEGQYANAKNVNNTNSTNNPDIRYSIQKDSSSWQEYLEKNFKVSGTRTNMQDILVQKADNKISESKSNSNNKLSKANEVQTAPKAKNAVEPESTLKQNETEEINNGKQRKHYKSIAISEKIGKEGKKIAKNLLQNDTYIPVSNKKQIENANLRIKNSGIDTAYESFRETINSGRRLNANDIALGEKLLQEYSTTNDIDKITNLVQDLAIAGTELGQAVQALSLVNRMTPEGQLMYLQKAVNRINSREGTEIKISKKHAENILNAKDNKSLENAVSVVTKEVAEQIPLKTTDKLRSWRYLSMLGNLRTHIRNVLSNVAMKGTMNVKNKIAGAIEDVVNPNERTKTLKRSNKAVKQFAKEDSKLQIDRLSNGSKENIVGQILSQKKSFDNKTLNMISEFNSNALEFEDGIFLKSAYAQALSNYITANNLSLNYLKSGTKEANVALEKARSYAVNEAQVATFRQFSALANAISNFENKNTTTKLLVGGILPFKKTPINIAKAGFEYSPVGLIKTITNDSIKLKTGKINTNQYIDNISKGLTGTSISVLGYVLAQAGILKASGDDDDRAESYDEESGNQQYSIKLGNKTYTIDWLSPSAMPLFVGAEFYNAVKNGEINLNGVISSTTKTLNPLTEMSMLQSFASTLNSYSQDGSAGQLGDMAMNMAESYVGQYFPTLIGQIARTIDDTERNTYYTDKKGAEARLQRFANKQIAKTPILSKTLEPKVNVWGEDVERDENILVRAFNQLINPSYVKEMKNSTADKEVQKLYKAKNDSKVLPKSPSSKFNINSEEQKLTPSEYTDFKRKYGTQIKESITQISNTKEYKNLTDIEKVKTIKAIYEDTLDKNKGVYAENKGINYEYLDEVDTAINNGLSLENAYIYRGNIANIKGNKNSSDETIEGTKMANMSKYIMNIKTNNEQKNLLLSLTTSSENKPTVEDLKTIGKENYATYYTLSSTKNSQGVSTRDRYVDLISVGLDDEEVNKYITNISKIKGIKNSSGNTISGSKKKNVYQYVQNLSLTRQQKLLLLAKDYKLSASEREEVFNYINKMNISYSQKRDLLKTLKEFTVKDNKVNY